MLASDGFVQAIRLSANHDGDSDSTASIAGQIHGAWKGLDGIPHAWIRQLDLLEPLLEMVAGMIAAFGAVPAQQDRRVTGAKAL